ncbi:hypothetical protein K466DRAFT_607711, partial [Polyporus arcularius HHB13444]
RDREQGKVVSQEDQLKGEEAGMHDLTEFENPYHRYANWILDDPEIRLTFA